MVLTPLWRAVGQLEDPALLGVLARSLAWSVGCFAALLAASAWAAGAWAQAATAVAGSRHWLGMVAGALAGTAGAVGAALLALWLFVPVAAVIAALHADRVALAVERHWYPGAPAAVPAPWAPLLWDGLALGLRVLALNLLALAVSLALPGVGWLLGWAIAGWALGRGLFMAVAMRHMPRPAALAAYQRARLVVIAQGGILVLVGWVPVLNLLTPIVGAAAMVHVLHQHVPLRR